MTPDEITTLAKAVSALRPDWPWRSIATYLATDHAHQVYRDVAIALAAVATDPASRTPRRLAESGWWWDAAMAARGETGATDASTHDARCPLPGHGSYLADHCGACRAEQLEEHEPRSVEPDHPSYVTGPALVRSAMRQAGIPIKEHRP